MPGKKYSAGAIFLQVVPVFADVQRKIEQQAEQIDRALGDSMEKSGKKAGERAGKAASKSMAEELAKGSGQFERDFHKNVDSINNALAGININKLGNDLRREVSQIKKEFAGLKEIDLTADADFKRVYAEMAVLEGRLRGVRDSAKIVFRADIDDALRGIGKIAAAKEAIEDPVEIKVSTDFKVAERQMTSFEKSFKKTAEKAAGHLGGSMNKEVRRIKQDLDALRNLRIGVDIGSNRARQEISELQEELRQIAATDPNIDVRVDAGRAYADIAALNAALTTLDSRDVKIDIDVQKAAAATGIMGALGLAGDRGANAFRSFNLVLLATTSIGPALIPILGGIAGGLVALGPAAAVGAAGLGSVLVGFSGVGNALQALGAQQDQAAMTAQTSANAQVSAANAIRDAEEALADARRNAARAAEDAAERVADAREAAADAIEDALERQKEAQEAYRDAVQDVKDAEEALAEARANAAGTGAELDRDIRSNELAIDQALLDSFNATVTFNAVMADGSATNAEQEQARIDREEALLRLEELRAIQAELAEEKRKWDEEGVNGTDEVKAAQDDLTQAIENQQEALEAMQEAAEASDEARVEGAEAVREALEDQRETAQDSARAIADAQQALARANDSYAQSLDQVNAQQNAVQNAMEKLGPAGERFARFLFGLRKGFYAFRDDIQAVMLPAVQEAIEGFLGSENASIARDALIGLAEGFGQFAKALSVSLQGEAWGAFFSMLADTGPRIAAAFGGAFISFMEAMASIMAAAAPLAVMLAEGFAGLMDSFARWAESKAGQESMSTFFAYVERIGPKVMEFFWALADAALAVLTALAPYGEKVLGVLTDFFNFISEMDPKLLGTIATAVVAILMISQIIFGVSSLIAGMGSLLTPVGAIVLGVVALVAALVYLWNTNEGFRDFVKKAWDEISTAVVDAWEKHLKPALADLWDAIKQLWDEVLAPFLAWLGPILVKIATIYFPLVLRYWAILARGLAWWIRNVIVPVFNVVGAIFKWLWEKIARPIFNFIKDHWKDVVNAIEVIWKSKLKLVWIAIGVAIEKLWRFVLKPAFQTIEKLWDGMAAGMRWTWRNVLKPMFDFITDEALPGLEGAFDVVVNAIKTIWEGLKKIVGAPIKFVLDTIINHGLIDGFNKVAGWVGHDGFDHIPIPKALQAYATGGVMPGYTPGRDVHEFVSPTAGRLKLSGGEAVMRPEWTAAMGPDYVNHMNSLARQGGVNAIRNAVYGKGAYWLGGILPLAGARVDVHGSGYSGYAADMNVGSGYDDYGMPVKAWKSGKVAQMNYIGDDSYGRWVILNHGAQSSLYAHLSKFASIAVGQAIAAGTTVGYVGDLGNTGEPPTSHLHFEINGGNASVLDTGGDDGGAKGLGHPKIPSWMKAIIKDPLGAVKQWVTAPIAKASDFITGTPAWDVLKETPKLMATKTADKVWDIIPGWAKTAVGYASEGADWVVGGVKNVGEGIGNAAGAAADFLGLHTGGILPYNGTMKYDAGGYLPPGLTSVVNLTGKPEPVFTNDQWKNMDSSADGGTIHYEPHFEGSDLSAEDVAADLNFTFRRIRRGGKYAGVGK